MPEVESGDCNVCVLNWDGDDADFYNATLRKARKPHECCECHGTIQPGQSYEHVVGKWDGDLSKYDTCSLCVEIRTKFSCNGSWLFTSMWDSLRDSLFDRLTTGCLTGLSVAAHEKVLEEWRIWKGLEKRAS